MTELTIHPLPLVKIKTVRGIMTYLVNIAEPLECYEYIWYIEGLKKRILVDAGGPAETFVRRGFPAENIDSPDSALKKVGLSPEDVDIIICTHLHYDHIEFGHMYKNATFIVQKTELAAAFDPHPIQKASYLPKETLKGLNFEIVEGDTQIVEGVKVLFTPGHTLGGQSVVVHTSRGKVIISGLCTIRDNFEPPEQVRHLMPVITPGHHLDAREAFTSLKRIKEEADIVIPLHEAEFAFRATVP